MDSKYDVFISYSRKDTAVADRICAALDHQGISYFIDRQGIGGGQEFPEVLAEAIVGCRIMLYLASRNSYDSKFTNNEITFAFNEKPKGSILPYIIDGSRLPVAQRFVFASVNIRTLKEHPIDTVLMQDLCRLLGRTFISTAQSPTRKEYQQTPTNRPSLPAAEQTFNVKGVSFKMIRVEGKGTPYYIGETQVTQALWKAVMGSDPSYFKGDNRPVEQISWDDCQDFIKRLNTMTGKKFRLPKDAEWEYAAKGGCRSHGYQYSGSNTIDEVAWYDENAYKVGRNTPNYGTHPVKAKKPNELGIYDMSGNVGEWCEDWSDSSCSYRVHRGGSWLNSATFCRVAFRGYTPSGRGSLLGFRLAL